MLQKEPKELLSAIQERFHALILERAVELQATTKLKLPELSVESTCEDAAEWFPVPGMYGGFKYWLQGEGKNPKLVIESWSRIVFGSGRRHEIYPDRSELISTGFV